VLVTRRLPASAIPFDQLPFLAAGALAAFGGWMAARAADIHSKALSRTLSGAVGVVGYVATMLLFHTPLPPHAETAALDAVPADTAPAGIDAAAAAAAAAEPGADARAAFERSIAEYEKTGDRRAQA
jgi:hypothetical protein